MSPADRYPETAEEIQAAAHTEDWQSHARLYRYYREKGYEQQAAVVLGLVRQRYGPRMADGLLEWANEESDEQRDPADGRCGSQSDPR